MAERLSDIERQIQNVRQLGAVVTALRGIAASRAQRGRALLAGIEAYNRVVSDAIGQALSLLPHDEAAIPTPTRSGQCLILFCAEQSFAGAFSERLFDAAGADIGRSLCIVIGTRGAAVAAERGLTPAWSVPMASHIDGIPAFANRLADALYRYVAQGHISRVDIIFSRAASGVIEVDRHSLLPIDFTRFTQPSGQLAPLLALEPHLLLERLAAEYVYAQLCEAAMHAFVAENEARMIAMVAAKNNTENKLNELVRRERQFRQEEITTEIIELAAGAEAARAASD